MNKSRDLLLEADEGDVLEEMAGDEAFIPEEVMQDKEKQRLIREIIDGLSDMQRLCVMGFYYNEQSQESIAEELGIPVNTVKSHLSRARAKIKAAMQELDVKKGTRLYNITPVLLTLIEEEIKSCVIQPMSAALTAGAGAAAAGVAAAVIVTTFSPKEEAVLSDEAKALFDEMIAVCAQGTYEDLCRLDYSVIDAVKDGEKYDNIKCYDKGGQIVDGLFYDGEGSKLKSGYTGHGIGIRNGEFAIGQFRDGKAEGRLIALKITAWDKSVLSDDLETVIRIKCPDVKVAEMNVEDGALVGEAANLYYGFIETSHQRLYQKVTGTVKNVEKTFDAEKL